MRTRTTWSPVMSVLLTMVPTTELTFPEMNLLEAGKGVLSSFQGGQTWKIKKMFICMSLSVLAPTRDSP